MAGTKVLLSLTEYDLRKETAETKYLSNFDASGYMTSHAATKDRWSRKTDTYGEYIGDAVKNIMRKKRCEDDLKCTLFTGHPVRRVHFALYD